MAIAVTAAGCTAGSPTPATTRDKGRATEPKNGGTLCYSIGEPDTLRPGSLQDDDGTQVAQAIFDSLTQVDFLDSELVLPSAAETWTVSADSTVWTFTLDRDRKFHEGTPVTAADFVYAWNRIAKECVRSSVSMTATVPSYPSELSLVAGWDSVRSGVAPELSGVKAVDDLTLQVTLVQPYADFDYVVAHPSLAPLLEKYVADGIDYEGTMVPFSEMPVGNGPFKMAAPWKHGREIKVVRNGDYRGTNPHVDAVDFLISRDATAAYQSFRREKLDFAPVPRAELATAVTEFGESANGYVANPQRQVLRGAENTLHFLAFNGADARLRDPALRRAISLAVNRKAVCETVFDGVRLPADNAVPPGVAGYQESGWADARTDVAAASAALREANSYKDRSALVLSYETGQDGYETATSIRSDLATIGIGVTLEAVERGTFRSRLQAGSFQFALASGTVENPTMDSALVPLFGRESTGNVSRFSNDAFERGVDSARATVPWNTRIARYLELNYVVQQTNPIAPLAFGRHHHIASDRVHGLVHSAQNLTDFSRVWLDEDKDE